MNNLGVSLSDYAMSDMNLGQVQSGNANISQEELSELSKALEAGSITGRETTNSTTASGSPLKVESLENTLKTITFKETDIQFWKRIPKLAAYNTVEEFNQLAGYGSNAGVFTNEGELPHEEDSLYIRKAEIVKFMGITKSVSHPMQLVKTMIGNVIQQEIKNGTLHLLRQADKHLAFGDANIVPQEFNGFIAQQRNSFTSMNDWMSSDNVIDMRGKALTETSIENGSLSVVNNFGQANLLMGSPVILSDFVKRFYDSKFIQPNTPALQNGIVGQRVQKFQSQFGEIDLGYDIFMNPGSPRKTTDGATHSSAPGVPTAVTATVVTGITDNKFNSAAEVGDFWYAVAAKNRFGESALVSVGLALTTVALNNAVDIAMTAPTGGNSATGFVVYRSTKNPTTGLTDTLLYPIFEVSTAQLQAGYDSAASGKVRDNNRYLPGTFKAILAESSEDVWSFKQLAPLMKMDLATLAPATRFMLLLYGTPMLYAPRKMVTYINVGRELA